MRLDLLQRMKLFRPHSVVGLPGRSVGLPGLWCLPLPRLNRWNVLCGSAPGDCGLLGSFGAQGHAAPAQRVCGLKDLKVSQRVRGCGKRDEHQMLMRCPNQLDVQDLKICVKNDLSKSAQDPCLSI